jgi:hypothetical protein
MGKCSIGPAITGFMQRLNFTYEGINKLTPKANILIVAREINMHNNKNRIVIR